MKPEVLYMKSWWFNYCSGHLGVAHSLCLGDGGRRLMRAYLQLELAGSYWKMLL